MEELQLALTQTRVEQRNFGVWIRNWQVGQTLSALVTDQRPSGALVLRVGGQVITATADIPVQQGSRLMLEFKQLEPVPTLKILNVIPQGGTQAGAQPSAIVTGGALQMLRPIGSEMTTVPLANMATALQRVELASILTPPAVDVVQKLFRQFSSQEKLIQPAGLRSALLSSGTFLEPRLLQLAKGRPGAPGGDLKMDLFRALAQVQAEITQISGSQNARTNVESLSNLKKILESALNRVTLNQLNSQSADVPVISSTPLQSAAPGTEQVVPKNWVADIPFFIKDDYQSFRIEIEQHPGSGQTSESQDNVWKVSLHLDLPATGAMDIVASMQGEKLDIKMDIEKPATCKLLDANVELLSSALQSRGVELRSVLSRVAKNNDGAGDMGGDASATNSAKLDLEV